MTVNLVKWMIILSDEIPFTSWLSLLPRNIYNINSKVEINNLDISQKYAFWTSSER